MTTTTSRGGTRVEQSAKRVRVLFGGRFVADTTRPRLVWETSAYPTYYLPIEAVAEDALVPTGEVDDSPRGQAELHTVTAGGRQAQGAAAVYRDSPSPELRGTVRFTWGDMDAWYEEDEEVFVHPRDPYKRVDILASSRHVRVEVDGVTVAESTRPTLLFETGLPTRYYLPPTDVRLDLLVPSDHRTACPYKGTAGYHHLQLPGGRRDNAVWSYRHPTMESARIAGLYAFYNERVDLYVDGELQARPRTPFS